MESETKKEGSLVFVKLNGNTHCLRVLGQDGKVACDIVFDRIVVGYDKDEKKCEKSFINLTIQKPVDVSATKMKDVKKFVAGQAKTNMMWLAEAPIVTEATGEKETI